MLKLYTKFEIFETYFQYFKVKATILKFKWFQMYLWITNLKKLCETICDAIWYRCIKVSVCNRNTLLFTTFHVVCFLKLMLVHSWYIVHKMLSLTSPSSSVDTGAVVTLLSCISTAAGNSIVFLYIFVNNISYRQRYVLHAINIFSYQVPANRIILYQSEPAYFLRSTRLQQGQFCIEILMNHIKF